MKSGDPFETEQTDEIRSRQRQLLRGLDIWTIRKVTANRPPLDLSGEGVAMLDTAMLEVSLRALIDEELAESEELRVLVGTLGRSNKLDQLSRVLRSRALVDSYDVRFGLGGLADSIGEQAREERAKAAADRREQLQALLLRVITLLILADDLASDDYKDPRLE